MLRKMEVILACFVVAVVLLCPGESSGQMANDETMPAEEWEASPTGFLSPTAFGSSTQFTVVHAPEFNLVNGSDRTGLQSGTGYIHPLEDTSYWWAQVDLPAGAEVTNICYLVYDNTATAAWNLLTLYKYESSTSDSFPPNWVSLAYMSTPIAATPGYTSPCVDLSANPVVINYWGDLNTDGESNWLSYILLAKSVGATDDSLALWGAVLAWNRTISAAPAGATFADVPTGYWAFQHIEALAASGITAGCGGGNFCPGGLLTRDQMAVFLAKALGLHWPN